MILLMHILSAVGGVAASSAAYFSPSKRKLRLTYVLTGATLLSGTLLVVDNLSHLARACVTGTLYLGVVLIQILAARKKLAFATNVDRR